MQGLMSFGHAVGPQWASQLPQSPSASRITLEYGVELTDICSNPLHQDHVTNSTQQQSTAQHSAEHPTTNNTHDRSSAQLGKVDEEEWAVTVHLSNGKSYGADLVISAIGVDPNTSWLPEEIQKDANNGGIVVDRWIRHAHQMIGRATCLHLVSDTPPPPAPPNPGQLGAADQGMERH